MLAEVLGQIVKAILEALIPHLERWSRETVEDSAPPASARERLHQRLRDKVRRAQTRRSGEAPGATPQG